MIESRAYARAGLLGNPSDGYFGKTISIIVRNFGAHISLYQSPELKIDQQEQDANIFKNIFSLVESIHLTGYYGGDRLIKAAIKVFCQYCEKNQVKLNNKNFTIRYRSSIPRQVGLAGSSAIIAATMKALMKFYNIHIPQEILPNLILAAETEELGINAGLQDRVIQVYEGCVYMDFNQKTMREKGHGCYETIDPRVLPSLYLAYKTSLGKVSGNVLNDIRTRYDHGDQFVIKTLQEIAKKAGEGKEALEAQQIKKLNHLINENFDLRKQIMNISESNLEMIETARNCGASAKFAGSGGSIIGIYRDDEMLTQLMSEFKKIGATVIKPYSM
jgi:glucuronokinase